jgi:hypothetical protein
MLAVVLVWPLVTSHVAAAPPVRPITIEEARSLALGTRVTIAGAVTTPSAVFASSFFDAGFAVQDRSAGIYVSLQTDLELQPNDHVQVTGVLADSFGLLILLPDTAEDVQVCAHGRHVSPKHLTTAAVGERSEGLLVSVTGVIVGAPQDDLPYGYKFVVDDGSGPLQIFVNLETEIDVGTLAAGQRVHVTGFSSQFDDHYEIDPRGPSDVRTLGPR